MDEQKHQTLGDNVTPLNYNITFDTNLKTFKFGGNEKIKVRVRKASRRIRLNCSEIRILGAKVASKGRVQQAKVSMNEKRQEAVLDLAEAIAGEAAIEINFIGTNNDRMYGFYRSRYTDKGKERYILTSQFEAAYARTAFPCFDEPAFKATFDVSIIIDNALEAASNMPIKGIRRHKKGRKAVTFNTTPRMSPYLLYLGVGNYDRVSGKVDGTEVNVITVPGRKALAKLPLDYCKRFLRYYNDYFGIKYPLPKVDLIGIPDFSAGAMENWGAIAFREIALLGDEKNSAVSVKQRIAEVIAHELAHQWFGDLVTMEWWNDIWLNESFATFMSYKAMDAVFPKWDMKTQYFDDTIAVAFGADALRSTHPVSVPIRMPDEIERIFDEISYEKGGTVLHMIENYAGAETFRRGLHIYLKRHGYGNASKYDLWKAIEDAGRAKGNGAKVTDMASYWIDEPGYPIINVKREESVLRLGQERFLILDERLPKKQIWPIPVHYVTENERTDKFTLMDREKKEIPIGNAAWVKLNRGQDYLYRVRYPDSILGGLGNQIKKGSIRGTDAWGVESDLFVLARSGRITLEEYLGFVERYCLGDLDYPLNLNISSDLGWFDLILTGKGQRREVERLIIRYHKRILGRLGWSKKKGDSNTTVMLRSAAISNLGRVGHKPTIKKALVLFDSYMKGKGIDPDLKGAILGIAAWTGDRRRYEQIVKCYKKENTPNDKQRFLQSLGLFRERELILRDLKFAYSKDVRLQDAYTLPAIISGNPVGKEMIWDWTRKNWKFLLKTHAVGTHMLDRFVENLSGAYTATRRREIALFFGRKSNMRKDIELTVAQTLERIGANINFMKANGIRT